MVTKQLDMKLNALTQKEISGLEPAELVKLLDILISNETSRFFSPAELRQVSIPLPITIRDGVNQLLDITNQLGREMEQIFNQWAKVKITDKQVKKLVQMAMAPNK